MREIAIAVILLTPLFFVLPMAVAQTGWAVGDGGVILATANGGTAWGGQASGVTAKLNSVFSRDGTTAWAVGDRGGLPVQSTILVGTGSPTTWSLVPAANIPVVANLKSVYFADGLNGWAVGDAAGNGDNQVSTILFTQGNGGNGPWIQQRPRDNNNVGQT